jgi:hypothetical protein
MDRGDPWGYIGKRIELRGREDHAEMTI